MPYCAISERFAGVAGDGDLFGIASGGGGQAAPDHFHLLLENVHHGVVRPHVAEFEIAAHGVLHRARRGAAIAVVQVDDVAVDGEGVADFAQKSSSRATSSALRPFTDSRGGLRFLDGVVLEGHQGDGA